MDAMLRLCIVSVDTLFTINAEVRDGEVTNIKPVLGSNMSSHMNFALEVFWFEGLNYTAIRLDSNKDCLDFIALNESDYMPVPIGFPVPQDFEKVNPFTILLETKMSMVQAYNRTDHSNIKTDIFTTSITGLNWKVWLSLFIVLVGLVFLLKTRQRFLKRTFLHRHRLDFRRKKSSNCRDEETSDAFFHVISAFCQQAGKEYNDFFLVSITFWIYMSSFFVITMHFCNVMSTDMIVVNKPDVVEDYDELFEKGYTIPTFTKQVTDYKRFEDAVEGSREFMFWENMKKYHEKDFFVSPQGSSFIIALREMYTRRRLFMITDLLQEAMRATACKMKINANQPRILTYSPVDPWSQRFAKGLVIKKSDNAIVKRIIRKMRLSIEMGINVHSLREMAKGILPEDMLPEDPPDMHDCMSETIVLEDPGFQAASLKNLNSLTVLCLILVFVSTVCTILEVVIKKFKK